MIKEHLVIFNHRQPGEDFLAFRERRRFVNRIIKLHLQRGVPAVPRKLAPVIRTPMEYVCGPDRTHKPHEVAEYVQVTPWTDTYGLVHDMRKFIVMHPGTLVRRARVK